MACSQQSQPAAILMFRRKAISLKSWQTLSTCFSAAQDTAPENAGYLPERKESSDGTNITKSKPDPEVFLKAADFLGVNAENCVVVEDAYAGIDAAKAAGMLAVGIGDASAYEKADYRIQKFSELERFA